MTENKITSQVHDERVILGNHIPLSTPFVIYIEPSGYCNLKCNFCPHGTDTTLLKKDIMSIDTYKKVMCEISKFDQKIELLRICGTGEPLTNKNLLELLKYSKNHENIKRSEIVTNATLFSSKFLYHLPMLVDRIVVSIEGLTSEDYMNTCNVHVDFQKLVDNIRMLYKQKKDCTIHIKIPSNMLTSKEKETRFFNLFVDYCDEIYVENLVPMWPQFKAPHNSPHFRYGGEIVKKHVCAQIFKGFQIQANGEVVPCCVDWKRINIIGNINDNSLLEIWNGDPLKKLQLEHLSINKNNIEPCKDCTMNDFCEIDNIDSNIDEIIQRIGVNK